MSKFIGELIGKPTTLEYSEEYKQQQIQLQNLMVQYRRNENNRQNRLRAIENSIEKMRSEYNYQTPSKPFHTCYLNKNSIHQLNLTFNCF